MVPPKTNFLFLFSNLGGDNGSTNQNSCQLFYGQGWHALCHSILKMHIVEEGPGETSSALRCFFYLIRSLLTDIKCLAKSQLAGTLSVPFWCLCQKLSLSLLYFNKTLLHKKFQVVKPHLWPQIEILSPGGHQSWRNTRLAAATFHQAGLAHRLEFTIPALEDSPQYNIKKKSFQVIIVKIQLIGTLLRGC